MNIKVNIKSEIKNSITKGTINCEEAHRVSTKLNINPKIVGSYVNNLNVKLKNCQLGLFGCFSTNELILEIKINSNLNCKYAWHISNKLNIEKKYSNNMQNIRNKNKRLPAWNILILSFIKKKNCEPIPKLNWFSVLTKVI